MALIMSWGLGRSRTENTPSGRRTKVHMMLYSVRKFFSFRGVPRPRPRRVVEVLTEYEDKRSAMAGLAGRFPTNDVVAPTPSPLGNLGTRITGTAGLLRRSLLLAVVRDSLRGTRPASTRAEGGELGLNEKGPNSVLHTEGKSAKIPMASPLWPEISAKGFRGRAAGTPNPVDLRIQPEGGFSDAKPLAGPSRSSTCNARR